MRILIIGAGAVGFHLARTLADEAHEVTLVDHDLKKVQRAADALDVLSVHGNGFSFPVLEEAGVGRAEILAAVSGSDEVNLLACMVAARRGVRVKIARVRRPEDFGPGSVLPQAELGVDLMISPEQECAWEIFQLLNTSAATDLARFGGGRVQLAGLRVQPDAPVVGRALSELDGSFRKGRFVLTAVIRGGRTVIPRGSTVLEAGDRIYVMAPSAEMTSLPPLAGYDPFTLKRVMIAGGSDEGVHLARHLLEHGVQCTLIERDRNRCRELGDVLPGALILNGDATDLDLLEMEGVEGIDGFVALTDRDEINMLSAELAKNLGARRVIPLIHRVEYMTLVDPMGLDAAVSPRISAANTILRYVRGSHVTSVATIKGSEAQAMETVVAEGASIVGMAVREIDFPDGAILGAIVRDGQVIMPRGGDRIAAGDHAVFFLLPEAARDLDRMLR